ncbi:integrase core domain-containing protein, partial [Candidatus Erwinia dacicola]|uniref:integrase core domain-containing protein n=1 Tax=Candidatus Erwinia dacicola TaxID=252393 RepID=UPI000A7072F6
HHVLRRYLAIERILADRDTEFQLQASTGDRLTDNGSAYTAHDTRRFARERNLAPCTTAVSSPQSNGMAERFVKTMKEDYIAFMPKPEVRTALRNLAPAFTHYNENHPHSARGCNSPREYWRGILAGNTGGSRHR